MKITTTLAREKFAELIKKAEYAKERIILTNHGKAAVFIAPLDDLELLELIEDQQDLKEALLAHKKIKKEGTKAWNEIKAEI
ncbi:MAG: type II toxin-antitoxin system prevent-host-death family antitoxin [Candidatus Margulisiibacteriota bacterium]|jgi:prevent-host-death family protein